MKIKNRIIGGLVKIISEWEIAEKSRCHTCKKPFQPMSPVLVLYSVHPSPVIGDTFVEGKVHDNRTCRPADVKIYRNFDLLLAETKSD